MAAEHIGGMCNAIGLFAVTQHDIVLLERGSAALHGKNASRPFVETCFPLTVAILPAGPIWVM